MTLSRPSISVLSDDLAPQPVLLQRIGEFFGDRAGEIAPELAPEIRIVGNGGLEQLVLERELGVGEQHRQLRPGQRHRAAAALVELLVVRQVFDRAVEQLLAFERLHQALEEAEVADALALGERDRERLQVIVAQDQRGDIVGHLREQRVARVDIQPSVAHRPRQRDLDIDLDVRRIDAGGIVDGVGVEPNAAQRRLDAAALGHAEIGALAHHLATQLRAGDTDRVVGAIADRVVGLRRRANIGADAAEEEEVRGRLQDGVHHLLRRRLRLGETDRRLRLR
jgi:hypothetical protein